MSRIQLTGALLALVLLALLGCGGGDGDGDEPAATEPPAVATTQPDGDPYGTPAISREEARAKRSRERQRERRRTRQRTALVRSVALSQLGLLQLRTATVGTREGARIATISLSQRAACRTRDGDARRIAAALRAALVFVEEVQVRVRGRQGSLARYRERSCGPRVVSAGTVLREAGTGAGELGPFAVRGTRWTLRFRGDEGPLRLLVRRGGSLVRQVVLPGGGGGERTLEGPGTFSVAIETRGPWSVVVQEAGP